MSIIASVRNEYRTYRVSYRDKEPLVRFIVNALHGCGCKILFVSPPSEAPFRITFETEDGERMGVIAYAFLANQRLTTNRPDDEHRFQVKYGTKDGKLHHLWQDPYGLYTTLFLGINTELGFFVGADPVLHSPTKFFISVEFKQHHVQRIMCDGWHAWERDRRSQDARPAEVLVGGKPENFLRYIRFEREALGEDAGHRQLLAERGLSLAIENRSDAMSPTRTFFEPPPPRKLHELAQELALTETEVLDLIESAPRLKMAVRGWVAEEHLSRELKTIPGVTGCKRITAEGGADVTLRFEGTHLTIECKNVLRRKTRDGLPRVDFQRTRASKADPCSRYYSPDDFNIVAACLHALTEHWEFRYIASMRLPAHRRCKGKLDNNVRVDERWSQDPRKALRAAIC